MPKWYEDLRSYEHQCGQPLQVGFAFVGYCEFPVFALDGKHHVITICPQCKTRLTLNQCRKLPPIPRGPQPAKPMLWAPAPRTG